MIYSFAQILSTPIEKDNVGDHLESIRKGHEKMSIYNVSLINYLLYCMLQPFNVLRYNIGQRYASHYDAFDPVQYGPQKSQRVCGNLLAPG